MGAFEGQGGGMEHVKTPASVTKPSATCKSPARASPGLHRRMGNPASESESSGSEGLPSPSGLEGLAEPKPVPCLAFVMGTFFSWSALGVAFFWVFSWPAGVASLLGTLCCSLFFSRLSHDVPAEHTMKTLPPALPPLGTVTALAFACTVLNSMLLLSTSAVFLVGKPDVVEKWLGIMGRTPVSAIMPNGCGVVARSSSPGHLASLCPVVEVIEKIVPLMLVLFPAVHGPLAGLAFWKMLRLRRLLQPYRLMGTAAEPMCQQQEVERMSPRTQRRTRSLSLDMCCVSSVRCIV